MNYYRGNTITMQLNGTTADDNLENIDFAVWLYCSLNRSTPMVWFKDDLAVVVPGLYELKIPASVTATMPLGIYTLEFKLRNADGSATGISQKIFTLTDCVSRKELN